MRKLFSELVSKELASNKNIMVLTGDLGYKMWDYARDTYSDQFFNVGSAEQFLLGLGIGLSMSGKIPILYSITPFLLYRPFELIRNYANNEKLPIKLVGSGRDKDYLHDGFSHWAEDDKIILSNLTNIKQYHPENKEELASIFKEVIYSDKPCYLNLRR
jgi:transketolase